MKNYFYSIFTICILLVVVQVSATNTSEKPISAIQSIETGYTILKVKTALEKGKSYIIGSSYEGTIVAYTFEGEFLWKNELSGFMNHDVWCADITNDGIDEILVANADGTVFCLNNKGVLL